MANKSTEFWVRVFVVAGVAGIFSQWLNKRIAP
jgi:hypothetical protein